MRIWYLAPMHPLAVFETVLKTFAFLAALVCLVLIIQKGAFQAPRGSAALQAGILTLLLLGLLLAIVDRYIDHEIFAMIFVFFNIGAHGIILATLFSGADTTLCRLFFFSSMLAGDCFKTLYFVVTGNTVRTIPRIVIGSLVAFYLIGYWLLIILE